MSARTGNYDRVGLVSERQSEFTPGSHVMALGHRERGETAARRLPLQKKKEEDKNRRVCVACKERAFLCLMLVMLTFVTLLAVLHSVWLFMIVAVETWNSTTQFHFVHHGGFVEGIMPVYGGLL